MTALIILLLSALVGNATYYDEGVFQDVWTQTRQYQYAPCAECIGYVSLMEPKYLDMRVWLSNGKETLGPFHVIDCANAKHLRARLAKGDVAELDTWLAKRWGAYHYGRIRVTVYFQPPEVLDGLEPVPLPSRHAEARGDL